jgi:acetolactate synthase-1/2/3 large subunit
MNGAESLVKTLLQGGVDVCFTNPGTSEMHFVAALDASEGMRCVLCLFEGVATGAADGYARMAEKPAATLLHLGPGLGNGLANLHNAKRARSPMVNIVGDHATYHLHYDAPLTSDIAGIASPVSHWVKSAASSRSVAEDGAQAIAAANSSAGQIATLILPADTAWEDAEGPAPVPAITPPAVVSDARIQRAVEILRNGESCLLLIGGETLKQHGQLAAGRIAAKTGAHIMAPMSNARMERGAGHMNLPRVPYPVDKALAILEKYQHVILICADEPVAFFAYPGKPGRLLPETCQVHTLARPWEDGVQALDRLVEELAAGNAAPAVEKLAPPPLPDGGLNATKVAMAVAAMLPENAIIADESVSAGRDFFSVINSVPAHSWLQIVGGSIGIGPPLATGAAVACPDRKVIALQADGSAMYTLQALWTQAREGLDVTTVILSNRAYAILQGEMRNVGATPGRRARDMLELDRPPLDWPSLARGLGIDAERATTAEEFCRALQRGLHTSGPYLIEAMI